MSIAPEVPALQQFCLASNLGEQLLKFIFRLRLALTVMKSGVFQNNSNALLLAKFKQQVDKVGFMKLALWAGTEMAI